MDTLASLLPATIDSSWADNALQRLHAALQDQPASVIALRLKNADTIVREAKVAPSNQQILATVPALFHFATEVHFRDRHIQTKAANFLSYLLKRLYKNKVLDLFLDWRRLELLVRAELDSGKPWRGPDFCGPASARVSSWLSLVKRARKYFTRSSLSEIHADYISRIDSAIAEHSSSFFTDAYIMLHFTPMHLVSDLQLEAESVLRLWRLAPRNSSWSLVCLTHLSRVFKKLTSGIELREDVVSEIFTKCSATLRVASANLAKLPQEHTQALRGMLVNNVKASIFDRMGVVFGHLYHVSQFGRAHFSQLLSSLDSFFHPSNSGKWTYRLAAMLHSFVSTYCSSLDTQTRTTELSSGIVSLVLPLAMRLLFTLGAAQYIAQQTIQKLAWLDGPAVYEQIRLRTDNALENPSSGLQISPCISALASVSAVILSMQISPDDQISQEIVNFAEALVPAIDGNDPTKTIAALKFYSVLFSHSTIGFEGHPFFAQLGSVAHSLLDRVIQSLRSRDAPSKLNESFATRVLLRLIGRVSLQLFAHAAEPTRLELLQTILNLHSFSAFEHSIREIGAICQAICRVAPTATLKALFSSSRLQDSYFYLILAASVRFAGHGLLEPNVRASIVAVLQAALHPAEPDASEEIHKLFAAGCCLLKNVLKALTETYPMGSSYCLPNNFTWGVSNQMLPALRNQISWFLPGQEHLAFASDLISLFVEPALSRAQALAGQKISTTARLSIRQDIRIVRYAIKGAALYLASDLTPVTTNQTQATDFLGTPMPTLFAFDADNAIKSLRGRVAEVLNSTICSLLEAAASSPDMKTLLACAKTANVVLSRNLIPKNRPLMLRNRIGLFKPEYVNPLGKRYGFDKYAHPGLLIDKAYWLLMQRSSLIALNSHDSADVDKFSHLLSSTSRVALVNPDYFAPVRQFVISALKVRRAQQDQVIWDILQVLDDAYASDEAIKAGILFAKNGWCLRRMCRTYESIEKFFRLLIRSQVATKPQLQEITLSAVGDMVSLIHPLEVVDHSKTLSSLFRAIAQELTRATLSRHRVTALSILICCLPSNASLVDENDLVVILEAAFGLLDDLSPIVRNLARRSIQTILSVEPRKQILVQKLRAIVHADNGFKRLAHIGQQLQEDHNTVGAFDRDEQDKMAQVQNRLQSLDFMLQTKVSAFLGGPSADSERNIRLFLLQPRSSTSTSRSTRNLPNSEAISEEEKMSPLNISFWESIFRTLMIEPASATSLMQFIESAVEGVLQSQERSAHTTAAEMLAAASCLPQLASMAFSLLAKVWTWSLPKAVQDFPWTVATRYSIQHIDNSLVPTELARFSQHCLNTFASLSKLTPWNPSDLERIQRVLFVLETDAGQLFSQQDMRLILATIHPAVPPASPIPDDVSNTRKAWASFLSVASTIKTFEFPKPPSYRHGPDLFAAIMTYVSTAPHESIPPKSKLAFLELVDMSIAVADTFDNPLISALPTFLPFVFELQQDGSDEVKKAAIVLSPKVSQLILQDSEPLERMVTRVFPQLSRHSSWKIRLPLLPFVQIFTFNHRFLLSDSQRTSIIDLVRGMLSDSSIEVREAACTALASVLRSLDTSSNASFLEMLDSYTSSLSSSSKAARTRKQQLPQDAAALVRSQHANLLALVACVQAHPYSVPSWMPGVLEAISRQSNEAAPIGATARRCIAEFWRTHHDDWAVFESAFTPEQVYSLKNHHTSSSYFA